MSDEFDPHDGEPREERTDDYEVGYRKPPEPSQFKPGQSGNPNGRPRGSPSLDQIMLREARRQVTVNVAGKPVKMTTADAAVRQLANSAMKGDRAAQKLFLSRLTAAEHAALATAANANDPGAEAAASLPDNETITRMMERLKLLASPQPGGEGGEGSDETTTEEGTDDPDA